MAFTEEDRAALLRVIDETTLEYDPVVYPDEVASCAGAVAQAECVELATDGVPFTVYVHRANDCAPACPVHINIHGGGFVCPHAENDAYWSAYLANRIHGIVVDVDYALTSSQCWPVGLDQCYAVIAFCQSQCAAWGADPARISMGGYSAGGTYAAQACVKAALAGETPLSLVVLGYAPVDLATPDANKPDGHALSERALRRGRAFNDLLFGNETERIAREPLASPLYADDALLALFPRTLICTAGRCGFRFEDEAFAAKLMRVGVEVTVRRFCQSRHGFIPHFWDEWRDAAELIVRAICAA